jgi:hypothetical protein
MVYICAMHKKTDLMPGTLDMLILKTLTRAPLHGYGIALSIKAVSDEALTVEEGSLYPALHEPAGTVLHADRGGAETTGPRTLEIPGNDRGDQPRDARRIRGRHEGYLPAA